jgi:hypothetical protein
MPNPGGVAPRELDRERRASFFRSSFPGGGTDPCLLGEICGGGTGGGGSRSRRSPGAATKPRGKGEKPKRDSLFAGSCGSCSQLLVRRGPVGFINGRRRGGHRESDGSWFGWWWCIAHVPWEQRGCLPSFHETGTLKFSGNLDKKKTNFQKKTSNL